MNNIEDTVFVLASKEAGVIAGNYWYDSLDEAQAVLDKMNEKTSRHLRPYSFARAKKEPEQRLQSVKILQPLSWEVHEKKLSSAGLPMLAGELLLGDDTAVRSIEFEVRRSGRCYVEFNRSYGLVKNHGEDPGILSRCLLQTSQEAAKGEFSMRDDHDKVVTEYAFYESTTGLFLRMNKTQQLMLQVTSAIDRLEEGRKYLVSTERLAKANQALYALKVREIKG